MRCILIRFAIIIGLSVGLYHAGVSASVADFYDISESGTSASTIRRGDVGGFSTYATGIFENPASIYRIYKISVSAFQTQFMQDLIYQNLSIGMRMPVGVLGIGVAQLSVDELFRTEMNDRQEIVTNGVFDYRNAVYKLAYQVSQSRFLHLGLAANVYRMNMDSVNGIGVNMELGAVLDGDVFDVSILLRNVIDDSSVHYVDSDSSEFSSQGKTENLPLMSVFGLRYRLNWLAFYGQIKSFGESRKFVKNGGVDISLPFIPYLTFSAGYREYYKAAVMNESETSEKVIQSATIGLGLTVSGLNFDYAFEKTLDVNAYAPFQQKHYFSVGFSI